MRTLLSSAWGGPQQHCSKVTKAVDLQPRAETFAGGDAETERRRREAMAQALSEVAERPMRTKSFSAAEGLLLPAPPKLDQHSTPSGYNPDDSEKLPVVNVPVVNVPSEVRERAQQAVLAGGSISVAEAPSFSYPCNSEETWPRQRVAADVDLGAVRRRRASSCHADVRRHPGVARSFPSAAMASSMAKDRLRFGITLVGLPYGVDLDRAGSLRPALETVLRCAVAEVAGVSESRVRVIDVGEAFWAPQKQRSRRGGPQTAVAPPVTAIRGGRSTRALLTVEDDKLCQSVAADHSMRALNRICSNLTAEVVRATAQSSSMTKELASLLDGLSELQFA